MNDGIGLAERLLGLDGFRVLEVTEGPDELVITIETTVDFVGCSQCGVRAEAHDRLPIAIRDLACFGRPARLVWVKRRWRCREPLCEARTWTEQSLHVDAQVVLTRRAGAEACRQVGELTRPVSIVAAELGVCWWTVMNAVVEHGTPRWTTRTASGRWNTSGSTRPRSWPPTDPTPPCTSPAWLT
jgi:transposase